MATIATLVAKLVGDIGPFQSSMKQAEQESKGIGERIAGGMNSALGTIGNVAKVAADATVAGFAAIGTAAFAAGMDIDSAYDSIIIKTGATGPALDVLKNDFNNVFSSIPTTAELAGNTLAEFNRRLGLTGSPLQTLTKNTLEMTRLLGGDAVNSAQLFSRVIGDWSIPTADASKSLNELFVVGQKTGVGTEKLMEQVVQFGSPMRLMGFSFQDTAALLAKWEKEGVNSELVMGSLRIAAGKFAKEGQPLRDSLLSTFNAIKNNKDATAALAQGMQIFGARAGPDMVAAIREGRFAIDDLVAAMGDAGNAIGDAASATEDFPEKFTVMKNKIEVALAPLGMLIMDGIGGALDAVQPILDKVTAAIKDFAEGATAAGGFNPLEGIANVFYGLAGADTTSIFQGLGDAFINLEGIVQPVIDNMIGGFQAIVAWVQANWPLIQTTIQTAWNNIQAVVGPAVQAIGNFIQSVFGAVGTFLHTHGEDIKNFLGTTWATIRSIVEPVITWFYTTITTVFGGLATWIQNNQGQVQAIFQGVWDGIKMFVGTVLEIIRGIVNVVLSLLKGDVQGALNAIKTMFTNIWDGIKGYVGQAVETMRMILLIAWAAIKQGVSDAWTGIRTWIENAWQGIVGFFNSLPGKLLDIGRQIIQGLVDGIKSAGDSIGQAIQGTIDNAIANIKKNLGIQSPSTVFAALGTHMMSGLALGIRSSADLPQAALTSALNGVTSPSMLLAGGGGNQTTINQSDVWNVQTDEMGMALLLERQRRLHTAQFEASM
jgi:phage-related minor tail protein